MNDDQAYNLPEPDTDQSGSTPPPDNQPAANLMREQLSSIYPTPTISPLQPPTQPSTPPSPPPLSPAQESVHGVIDKPRQRSLQDVKQELLSSVRGGSQRKTSRLKPFLIALGAGLLYLALSYNEIAIAQVKQYISPGSNLTTPVIVDPTVDIKVGKEPRVIIPKINVDVPVVYDIPGYDEHAIQAGLERGVVHYGQTAVPGQIGNNVIVGHSSNNFFNSGQYKFAFVLLGKLEVGDTFILNYGGQRYIYKVKLKKIIEPSDFSLIQPTDTPVATLITCTPPGTSWHRLVIQGEQISPDPSGAKQVDSHVVQDLDEVDTVVPSNAPSFWSNFFNLFD